MTINCKGKLIDLSTPKVMGILNVTPDSFFDGGRYKDETSIIKQVENMLMKVPRLLTLVLTAQDQMRHL